jgi:hypothetical protein
VTAVAEEMNLNRNFGGAIFWQNAGDGPGGTLIVIGGQKKRGRRIRGNDFRYALSWTLPIH